MVTSEMVNKLPPFEEAVETWSAQFLALVTRHTKRSADGVGVGGVGVGGVGVGGVGVGGDGVPPQVAGKEFPGPGSHAVYCPHKSWYLDMGN